MEQHERIRGKTRPTFSLAALFATALLAVVVLAMVLLALAPASASSRAAPVAGSVGAWTEGASAGISPATIPATTIYLNLSESGTTQYYREYVTLNNGTTLYRLPYVDTASAAWVTVANVSTSEGTFHSIEYAQATTGNDTGTVIATQDHTGFELLGGNQYWIDYQYWTFNIYVVSAPSLGEKTNLNVTFGDWPGHTTGPAALEVPIGGGNVASLKVSDNVTVGLLAARNVTEQTGCNLDGTICTYDAWNFTGWQNKTASPASDPLDIGSATGEPAPAGGYDNYTLIYTNSTYSTSTGIGAFFVATSSALTLIFLDFWYVWLLVIVLLVAYAYGRSKSRRRRR